MLSDQRIAALEAIVGSNYVLTDAGSLKSYGTDWTKVYPPNPCAVVLPKQTEEVSAIMKYCSEHGIAVVPSGGRTGLAGAAVATNQELIIALQRMNRIERIDAVGLSIWAEAGVTTQELQEAAASEGLSFPLDLAAKGSSQLGGNIAANIGGVKFIRYGGAREQLLGLEVVLASGEILNLNTALRKNNTGYDLKQLFVGSEGTLGIITRAKLKLMPAPKNLQVALLGVETFGNIPQILAECNRYGATVTAFEFFTKNAYEIVIQHSQNMRPPFESPPNYFVLIEVEEGLGSGEVLQGLLEKIFEAELVIDGVLGTSTQEAKDLWSLRENITESIGAHGHVRKNDIALAVHELTPFLSELETLLSSLDSPIELVLFGHIGDGNLHLNYVGDSNQSFETFQNDAALIERQVFDILERYSGSISAEHGIGLLKKNDLRRSRTEREIDLMRQIKKVFDPQGILNPGKIFDLKNEED